MAKAARGSVGHRPVERSARARPAAALRRCIVTGAVRDKAELLRFVIGPDDRVVPDVAGRLPGRGLWLSPTRNVVKTAVAKAAFARAARRAVSSPEDLDQRVERLLVCRLMDGLGLARRAGEAVAGFEKVRAFLGGGPARVLFIAGDAPANAVAKGRLLQGGRTADAAPRIGCLRGTELGAAFGRGWVVYAAVRPGPLAERIVTDAARLGGFRDLAAASSDAGEWTSKRHD